MSFIKEYDTALQRDCDIIFKQFEIDVLKIENALVFESTIQDVENMLFNEAETLDINTKSSDDNKQKSQNKFTKTMSAIANAVTKLISDIIDTFANMFSNNSHVDTKAYLNSAAGSIELDNDLKRVQEQVNTEVRKGRKLIQSISKGTGIDDAVVEQYVDRAAKGVQQYGKTAVATAGSYALFQHATGGLTSLKNEMISALKECRDTAMDPNQEVQVTKLYDSMKHWIAEGTQVYAMFGNKINEEAQKQQKNKNK